MYKNIVLSIIFGALLSACMRLPGYGPETCEKISGFEICTATDSETSADAHRDRAEYAQLLSIVAEEFDREFPGAEDNMKEKKLTFIAFSSEERVKAWCGGNGSGRGCYRTNKVVLSSNHINREKIVIHELLHHAAKFSTGTADNNHSQEIWYHQTSAKSLECTINLQIHYLPLCIEIQST